MDIKKLKTSQLLDMVEDTGDDDVLFGELIERIDERIPFAYILERIEELENENIRLEKEIENLRKLFKSHAHLNGKVVTEI